MITGLSKVMKINAFRFRLFLYIALAILVPVLFFGILLFSSTQNTLKENTSGNIQDTLVANFENIESKFGVMDNASNELRVALAKIPNIIDPAHDLTKSDLFEAAQYPMTVYSSLIVDTYSIAGFNHFYLYFPYRSLLLVSRMSTFDGVNPNVLDCHYLPEDKWGVSTPYENVISNPAMGQTMNQKNISKNLIIQDTEGNELILTTNVKERYINELLISGLHIKPSYAVIMDNHGGLISSMSDEEIGQSLPQYRDILSAIGNQQGAGQIEILINGKPHLLNWVYSQSNEWYYVIATGTESVTEDMNKILGTLLIIVLGLVVLSYVITVVLANSMAKPLKQLSTAMTEIKNRNFNVKLPIKPNAEFGAIYAGFNEMASEICSLVNDVSKEQSRKTVATIQMLQTEINPHMLYNSLESLYSIAKLNKQDEIASLVMALSRFFRIALSGGKHTVPFREAFELANQYITVQNIRLNYKISFTYDIPQQIYGLFVPKFLLQPVIENSILHGFQNKRDEWRINITAKEEGDLITIIVRDNGIGIHETALEKLNRRMNDFDFEDNTVSKGYALRNLNYQIKLKYGESSGIRLNSLYGEYTEAVIRLHTTDKTPKHRN